MYFDADSDTQVNLCEEGKWFDYEGAKFKIAHISNLKFQRALAKLQHPFRNRIEKGTMDPGKNRDIVCEAMSIGIVLDFDKVKQPAKDGKPERELVYSSKLVEKMLKADPAFRDWVSERATSMDNFRNDEIEELGND